MNGTMPQNPTPASGGQKKVGLFTLLFIGTNTLVLLFLVLSYFNILPLSSLFPNQLGFLPRRDVPTGTSQQSQQLKISCPSVKEFCEKGEGIIKDQKYVGLGYKLSSGSAIFAAFDGNVTATFSAYTIEVNGKTTQQNFEIVYLDNPNLSLRGIYLFRGPRAKIKIGQVFKGQQIAEAGGKTISIYNGNSLIFSLIPGYPTTNTPTILNKENFE